MVSKSANQSMNLLMCQPHQSKEGMSKTNVVEQILTSYWSIKQPIMCIISSCSNPHKSKEGMSKTKVEQVLTSY